MNQIKAGAILNYVIIGLNAVVGLAYTPFMLRCLGQNEYGLYSLVASIIAYLTLLDFGFGPTVVRYAAKYIAEGKREEQFSLYGLFFRLYSVIGAIALAIGALLYFNINFLFDRTMTPSDLTQARIMIMLLLVNLAVTFPMGVFGSIITAYERFVFQNTVRILRIVLSTAVMVCVLLMGHKAVAMVVIQTIFNLSVLAINYAYCRNKLHIQLIFKKFDFGFIKELLGFSIWVFIGDVMFKFYYSTGQFVLGATSGTVAVAVFALGVTLMQMYIMFSGGISGVLLPKITSMVARNCADKEISDLFIRVGRLQFVILGLVLGGFIVFGRNFIKIWAGDGYGDVYYIAIILFASTLIPLIQNTAIAILQARNQLRWRAVMLLIVSAIGVVAQIILSYYLEAIGCAIAVGAANLLGQGLILNWYYHKRQNINIPRFWMEIVKMTVTPAICTCMMAWAYMRFGNHTLSNLVIWIIAFTVLYCILCWKFSLNASERSMLSTPILKLLHKK